jgi:hypothetical protein
MHLRAYGQEPGGHRCVEFGVAQHRPAERAEGVCLDVDAVPESCVAAGERDSDGGDGVDGGGVDDGDVRQDLVGVPFAGLIRRRAGARGPSPAASPRRWRAPSSALSGLRPSGSATPAPRLHGAGDMDVGRHGHGSVGHGVLLCLVLYRADRLQAGPVEPRDPALLDLVDRRRVEVVKPFPSAPYDGDQVGLLKDVEMLCR